MKIRYLLATVALLLVAGCATNQNYVISGTGTVIGVEIGQNPSTQMYHAKLGYVRSEIALVPTNKGTNGVPAVNGGAKDTPNVLMELRFGGIFSTGTGGGIYQRLAVGETAVAQPGAAVMFAKDANGNLSSNAVEAVTRKIERIPLAPR